LKTGGRPQEQRVTIEKRKPRIPTLFPGKGASSWRSKYIKGKAWWV